MSLLALAMVLLILGHALPSAPPLRERLIARLGRPLFFSAYGILSLGLLALVIVAYQRADPGILLYLPPPGARTLALVGMPLAIFLVVARLTQKPGPEPAGVYRISATPGSAGLLLWCALHLLNLGSARQILLFAGMAAIALIAMVKNAWLAPESLRRVGPVPFLALLRGGEPPAMAEIGWWRLVLSLALYALLLALHPLVIGRDPLAGWL